MLYNTLASDTPQQVAPAVVYIYIGCITCGDMSIMINQAESRLQQLKQGTHVLSKL